MGGLGEPHYGQVIKGMYYQTEAIILKNQDFKETDKLVTLLTREEGKMRAVAKGIKKPSSTLRGVTQPFCHCQLQISRGRELHIITQGRIISFYGSIREDFNRTLQAVYLMELLDKSLLEADPHPRLFDATLLVLQCLDSESYFPLLMRWFELALTGELGYKPELDRCAVCQEEEGGLGFSIAAGGLLCGRCTAQHPGETVPLDGETLALLRSLAEKEPRVLKRMKVSPRAARALESLLEKYLEYYLERKFHTKHIIRSLKKVNTLNE